MGLLWWAGVLIRGPKSKISKIILKHDGVCAP